MWDLNASFFCNISPNASKVMNAFTWSASGSTFLFSLTLIFSWLLFTVICLWRGDDSKVREGEGKVGGFGDGRRGNGVK